MTNLQEILHHVHFDEHDEPASSIKESLDGCEIVIAKAQAAIAELVDKCIGPDEPIADIKWQLKNPTKDPYERNKLKAEIRNNLKQKGLL